MNPCHHLVATMRDVARPDDIAYEACGNPMPCEEHWSASCPWCGEELGELYPRLEPKPVTIVETIGGESRKYGARYMAANVTCSDCGDFEIRWLVED